MTGTKKGPGDDREERRAAGPEAPGSVESRASGVGDPGAPRPWRRALPWLDRITRWGLAAMFLLAASGKFSPGGNLALQFEAWGYPFWLLVVVGVLEGGGALLLLVNRAVVPGLAALAGVMAGAIVTHLRFPDTMGMPVLPGVTLLVIVAVAIGRIRGARSTPRGAAVRRRRR